MSDANRDDEIVEIAPYVMKALVARYFFKKLDDELCVPCSRANHEKLARETMRSQKLFFVDAAFTTKT